MAINILQIRQSQVPGLPFTSLIGLRNGKGEEIGKHVFEKEYLILPTALIIALGLETDELYSAMFKAGAAKGFTHLMLMYGK